MICGVPSVKKTIRGIVFRRAREGVGYLKIKRRFLLNFPLGLLVGFLLAMTTLWLVDTTSLVWIKENAAALISGMVTLFAAILAVAGVLTNIENQNNQASIASSRSLAAAKSILPLALSQMSPIAKRGAEICMSIRTGQNTGDTLVPQVSLPSEIIPAIKEAIEHSTQVNGERLANLIRTYQVLASRTERWLNEEYVPLLQHYDQAVNWAILCRLIEDCFEYSRNEVEGIPTVLSEPNLRRFFSVTLQASESDLAQVMPAIENREAMRNFEIF